MLTLGQRDGITLPATLIDQVGPDQGPLTVEWQARDNHHFFMLVQRLTGTASVVAFDIEVTTTLSLLLARPAGDMSLTCQEETSGWGADDIALQIRADGDLIADIPNVVIGDFEDDSVRHIGDKVAAPITAYTQGIEIKVIEEDDIDPDDVGVGTVPLVGDVAGAPSFTVFNTGSDGTIHRSLGIGVDDGKYAFMCKIARLHPLA